MEALSLKNAVSCERAPSSTASAPAALVLGVESSWQPAFLRETQGEISRMLSKSQGVHHPMPFGVMAGPKHCK